MADEMCTSGATAGHGRGSWTACWLRARRETRDAQERGWIGKAQGEGADGRARGGYSALPHSASASGARAVSDQPCSTTSRKRTTAPPATPLCTAVHHPPPHKANAAAGVRREKRSAGERDL
eukprot:3939369-Rhodomonas_salina.1